MYLSISKIRYLRKSLRLYTIAQTGKKFIPSFEKHGVFFLHGIKTVIKADTGKIVTVFPVLSEAYKKSLNYVNIAEFLRSFK